MFGFLKKWLGSSNEKEIARLCEAALHGAISPETAAESINAVIPK